MSFKRVGASHFKKGRGLACILYKVASYVLYIESPKGEGLALNYMKDDSLRTL